MSIFICIATESFKDANTEHLSRNVKGRRAPPSSLSIIPFRSNPVYGSQEYAHSFHKQVKAFVHQTPIHLSSSYRLDFAKAKDLPLPLPPIVFVTKIPAPQETIRKLGMVAHRLNDPKLHGYRIDSPSERNIPTIEAIEGISVKTTSVPGYASVASLKAFIMIRKLFASTLDCYCPPAPLMRGPYALDDYATYNRFNFFTSSDATDDEIKAMESSVRAAWGDDIAEKWKAQKVTEKDEKKQVATTHISGVVPPIKAGYRKSRFTTPNAFPNTSGILFPYFDRMMDSDSAYIINVVGEFFAPTLGDTDGQISNTLAKISELLPSAIRTKEGAVLTHMAVMVRFLFMTGTTPYVIHTGSKYLGFALCGLGFNIMNQGARVQPVLGTTLKTIVSELGTHESALLKVASITSLVAIANGSRLGTVEEITLDKDLTSSLEVWREISWRAQNLSDGQKSELVKACADIDFDGETFVEPTAINLVELCDLADVSSHFQDKKVHLIESVIFNPDPLASLLSQFGPSVPSINFPQHRHIRFAKDVATDSVMKMKECIRTVNGKEVKQLERDLKVLYVRKTSLREAVADWKSVFLGSAGQPLKLDKRAASGYIHLKDDDLKTLWFALYRYHRVPEVPIGFSVKDTTEEGMDVDVGDDAAIF
jgi:hypothetical protein